MSSFTTPADCGSLPNPLDGQVSLTDTTEGSVATYSCLEGFILQGTDSESRMCQSDGTWSGVEPYCEETILFSFGFAAGDQQVPPGLDSASPELVKVELGGVACPFFGAQESTIYVSCILALSPDILDFYNKNG